MTSVESLATGIPSIFYSCSALLLFYSILLITRILQHPVMHCNSVVEQRCCMSLGLLLCRDSAAVSL